MLLVIVMERRPGVEGKPEYLEDVHTIVSAVARRTERVGAGLWLAETSNNTAEWLSLLERMRGQDDRLLIAPLRARVGGMLPAGLWDWINSLTGVTAPGAIGHNLYRDGVFIERALYGLRSLRDRT